MADAVGTIAGTILSLPNNTEGLIFPQDVRNMLVSLTMQHGQLSVAGNSTPTVLADTITFVEADVTGVALSEVSTTIEAAVDFEMLSPGQLRFIGLAARHFHISCSLSFMSASNNQEIHWQLGKNDVPSSQSDTRRKTGTGGDVGSTAIHWMTPLAAGDHISLFAKNVTTASNITVVSYNLQVVGMIK